MRSAVVLEPAGPLVLTSRAAIAPARGQVRVRVIACGMCRADLGTLAAREPSYGFPLTPGHEVAGVIAELGEQVTGWQVGDRVVVGWFGGSCGHCAQCRVGDVVHCPERRTPGVDYPGGWAEALTVPAEALARIPEGLDFVDAAPLGCAGVTVLNAIRHAGVRAGGTVAVFGLGGLGHLAVLYAAAMGFRTIALARGADRKLAASELGAVHYIDTDSQDPATALRALGGADLILSTAATTAPVAGLLAGLRTGGRLVVAGVDGGDLTMPAAALVANGLTVAGTLTGSAHDIEEAMEFAVTNRIRPVIESIPLAEAAAAAERLEKGQVRFRLVLETGIRA